MKLDVTREEFQLILDSLDYRENFYASSGAEVLPELNVLNALYNRLSEIHDPEQELKLDVALTPEKIADGAIEMFLEYRDKHGRTEEGAKVCAIQEVLEEIQAIKHIEAGESEFRRQLATEQERGIEI